MGWGGGGFTSVFFRKGGVMKEWSGAKARCVDVIFQGGGGGGVERRRDALFCLLFRRCSGAGWRAPYRPRTVPF